MEKGITYTGLASQYKEELEEKLMNVMDTEIGLDIVNLGLIYGIDLDDGRDLRIPPNLHGCRLFLLGAYFEGGP